MLKTYNPTDIAPPFGHYDHGVEAVDVSRLLHVSGQVGVAPDGTVPDDVAAQIECVWRNIEAVLADAGMTAANIVRTITYMLDADYVPLLAAARAESTWVPTTRPRQAPSSWPAWFGRSGRSRSTPSPWPERWSMRTEFHSSSWDSPGSSGIEWDRWDSPGSSGIEWDGIRRDRWDSPGSSGIEWDKWDSPGFGGIEWDIGGTSGIRWDKWDSVGQVGLIGTSGIRWDKRD